MDKATFFKKIMCTLIQFFEYLRYKLLFNNVYKETKLFMKNFNDV